MLDFDVLLQLWAVAGDGLAGFAGFVGFAGFALKPSTDAYDGARIDAPGPSLLSHE